MTVSFQVVCLCGQILSKEVEHRQTVMLNCQCGQEYEAYAYYRKLPQPTCEHDELVKLGVLEAMRQCQ